MDNDETVEPILDSSTSILSQRVSLHTRLAHEIPKPLNWQDFQRKCSILFSDIINDPYIVEYGRNGQKQKGIDLLGRRDGAHDYHVGIQCRLIVEPLKKKKILTDCREALTIQAGLKKIIWLYASLR